MVVGGRVAGPALHRKVEAGALVPTPPAYPRPGWEERKVRPWAEEDAGQVAVPEGAYDATKDHALVEKTGTPYLADPVTRGQTEPVGGPGPETVTAPPPGCAPAEGRETTVALVVARDVGQVVRVTRPLVARVALLRWASVVDMGTPTVFLAAWDETKNVDAAVGGRADRLPGRVPRPRPNKVCYGGLALAPALADMAQVVAGGGALTPRNAAVVGPPAFEAVVAVRPPVFAVRHLTGAADRDARPVGVGAPVAPPPAHRPGLAVGVETLGRARKGRVAVGPDRRPEAGRAPTAVGPGARTRRVAVRPKTRLLHLAAFDEGVVGDGDAAPLDGLPATPPEGVVTASGAAPEIRLVSVEGPAVSPVAVRRPEKTLPLVRTRRVLGVPSGLAILAGPVFGGEPVAYLGRVARSHMVAPVPPYKVRGQTRPGGGAGGLRGGMNMPGLLVGRAVVVPGRETAKAVGLGDDADHT